MSNFTRNSFVVFLMVARYLQFEHLLVQHPTCATLTTSCVRVSLSRLWPEKQ